MHSIKRLLVLLAACFVVLASLVAAQKQKVTDKGNEEFLRLMRAQVAKAGVEKTSDLVFKAVVTGEKGLTYVSGQHSNIDIFVANKGTQKHTIFGVFASLTNSGDYNKVVRNLTLAGYQIPLKAGSNLTFTYPFSIETEAMELGYVLYVDYYDSEEIPHRIVAFSTPVKVVFGDSLFDLQSLSIIIVIGGLIAGGVYLSNTSTVAKTVKKEKAALPSREEVELKRSQLNEDWIPEHVLKAEKAKGKKKAQ
ncbi:uncharacterized protein BJ171DRAFT_521642 [Polychytrium aggregatum]|uniref:uncharacterized protein n=1 Tax=Polychytrium aggregatum TaxID=110093 RepID=UPI0022FEA1A8|nr:uncharacterized protein BJ171DRAFT_521642 [Polychytrium aggregatum]KAI9197229.1 hypothetical protein BJ171DRAFT_521642 [Polychytrium aggregatum]